MKDNGTTSLKVEAEEFGQNTQITNRLELSMLTDEHGDAGDCHLHHGASLICLTHHAAEVHPTEDEVSFFFEKICTSYTNTTRKYHSCILFIQVLNSSCIEEDAWKTFKYHSEPLQDRTETCMVFTEHDLDLYGPHRM